MDLHEMAIELAQEKLTKVNRLEVIDEDGRSYTRHFRSGESLRYDFQDDGATLKIFVDTPDHPVSDSREEIEVDFTDEELLEYMKQAHEMDITFNQFVERVLRKYIEEQ